MEEVRQLVQEEGREARNLVAFHVAVDPPAPTARVARKPPRGAPPPRRVALRSAARLRSASAGRDKRSELRARYWALLFGDLQRSVGEIYNTVEAHENLNECQEVILVLENYTRDFKALGEWFRLKWEYDNTPPPQRPQSLAWEIRKTDFVRPESRRTHSVKSSPSVSGKNSPCLSGHNTPSGKNSPNLTGKASPGSGKISPRISNSSTSPKGSIEFFSNKIASKIATKPEPKIAKETRLSDIKEKDVVAAEGAKKIEKGDALKEKEDKDATKLVVGIGKAKEYPNVTPKPVVVKTLKRGKPATEDKKASSDTDISSQAKATIAKLHAMEKEFLAKQLAEHAAKNENLLNRDFEQDKMTICDPSENLNESANVVDAIDKDRATSQSPAKSEDNFADVSNESSKSGDEKPANIINANTDEPKLSTDLTVTSTENKSKNVTMKKKDATNSSVNKDSAAKVVKDINKREKLAEAKDSKKEPNNKITKHAKEESVKKEDSDIDKNEIKKINWAEYCETDVNEVKDISNMNNKKDDQEKKGVVKKEDLENKLDNEKKPESKSPEPNNAEAKDSKKEDNDSKKAEAKGIDAKPRPAYSQAAAKPKLVTAKAEVKTPTKTTLYRSKTVVEIRPISAPSSHLRPTKNAKNKCSYPFNLTTGRTSLFDTPGATKVTTTKKPTSRPQLAAGDAKNPIKPDHKTVPPRLESPKINEQGDKEEKINPAYEKIKDCDVYSSSETVVAQLDMSRIESSESLKTIVPEGSDMANSIEVLNVDGEKNDNDGWLTVKSRRLSRESKKSKCHWANRFRQPSATTSLPTLNIIESPKSNTIDDSKLDRAKSEQPQNTLNTVDDSKLDRGKTEQPQHTLNTVDAASKLDKAKSEQPQHTLEKVVKGTAEKDPKARDASMIRQKSDVTGLKTRSSRNKALKKDKNRDKKDSVLTKNRLHSSLESLTTGLARSQESTEEDAFDFDKWKAEFMNTFKYLEEDDQMTNHNEILKTADPSEMSEIAEMTSQIEENERKISLALDFQSEADQKKLCEEEDLLNRQIMELQHAVSDIDIDTETDDTETDAEIICDHSAIVPCKSADYLVCRNLTSCLEHHYEKALEGMTWSERIDMLGVLEELVARDPEAIKILIQGRAQQLHAKLSQGIRRRGSLQDVLRRLQAKQARAEQQRMEQHTERAKRIHRLLGRVEEVKMAKNQLIEEKRNRMERRLQKAAENRDQHLKDIVRKAHDEEEKLREIAFIKQLEAENRRHEFLEQCRSLTTRLRQMRRERLDKLARAAAREAAVGARRQALEAARRHHVQSLLDKRRERDARREELKEQRKQERDDAAREKAEGVKSRLSALAAAAELEALALRSRIRDKQDASQLRLESHLQAIREKATGPRQPTISESQEACAKEASAAPREAEAEAERRERERLRVLRKKARKIKQKILNTSKEAQEALQPRLARCCSPARGGVLQRLARRLAALLHPHLHVVTAGTAVTAPTDNNEDFKYDFEDKMGKRKRKKKAQEKAEELQKNKQKNRSNDTKGKGKGNAPNDDPNRNNNVDAQENKNDPEKDTLQNTNETQNVDSDAPKQKNEQKNKKNKKKINAQNETQKNDDVKKTKTDMQKNNYETQNDPEIAEKNKSDAEKGQNQTQKGKNETQTGKNDTQKGKNETQKGKNETQRLRKSESICSEGSKASAKSERPPLMLDVNQVEKIVGELYRLTCKDINDRSNPICKFTNVAIHTKIDAIKTFGQLFTILAEREDLLSQLTHKCLAMCAVTSTRLMASCKPTALYFFSTTAAVHVVCLLNYQLNKDLSDRKDMEVTKQLCDLVSVCLDAALVESRTRECTQDEIVPMGAIRARAHNLISYLCLSGTIAHADRAGEAREGIQTMVTLCADLCQPHKTDTGSDRVTALQSLRSALGTDLMGSRAEFCMLFAEGAELSRSQNFVRAARTTHLLRQLAELDHQIVQDAFGEDGWALEFRAAVARLLSQHAPNDKEAPDSDVLRLSNQRLELSLSEQMVLDLIVLVGFVVVNNPGLHDTICENWGVSKTLCTLPANWLVSEFHCHSLLPTLVVLAERPDTAKVISSEISMKMLENYATSPEGKMMKLIQVLQAAKDKAAKKDKQGRKDKPKADDNLNVVKHISNGDAKNDTNSDETKDDLTNGDVKHGENEIENDSDTESIVDEV